MFTKIFLIALGVIIIFLAWYLSAVRYHRSRSAANEMLFKEFVTIRDLIDETRQDLYADLRARSCWSIVALSVTCGLGGLVIIVLAVFAL